jgi:glutamate N-acetyltransferase/amino-acid N-acetyltransferase
MPTTTADSVLDPLPSRLPAVEHAAVIPSGFAAGATVAGIKASGRPDLAVIRTTAGPAATAAVFTTNTFAAAPVLVSRTNLAVSARTGPTAPELPADARPGSPDDPDSGRYGFAEAIVSTSGCAYAATGLAGLTDQLTVSQAVAATFGTDPLKVLCLSTGLIGTRLPVDLVRAGLTRLADGGVTETDAGFAAAAEAFRTTDSVTKMATTTLALPDADGLVVRQVRVTGIAKGVGMIHPRMATMLSVILTDATVGPLTLSRVLRPVTARTWNQLTVDGDTSTNDTVFVLASGTAGAAPILEGSREANALREAIEAVARDLARQQAADGEGASSLITCQVSGATDDADARAVAREVVASSLVKAAVHGRDPNWGRIAGAAGNARLPEVGLVELGGMSHEDACARAGRQARIDPERVRIAIAGHLVFDGPAGGPRTFDRSVVRDAMTADEVLIRLDLGLGEGTGEAYGCDLTEEYVRENSEYST